MHFTWKGTSLQRDISSFFAYDGKGRGKPSFFSSVMQNGRKCNHTLRNSFITFQLSDKVSTAVFICHRVQKWSYRVSADPQYLCNKSFKSLNCINMLKYSNNLISASLASFFFFPYSLTICFPFCPCTSSGQLSLSGRFLDSLHLNLSPPVFSYYIYFSLKSWCV